MTNTDKGLNNGSGLLLLLDLLVLLGIILRPYVSAILNAVCSALNVRFCLIGGMPNGLV